MLPSDSSSAVLGGKPVAHALADLKQSEVPEGQALVTIVIPAWNAACTVVRAVESALAQTEPRIEIVVVDDGSTDDTYVLAQACAETDGRVRLIAQDNRGTAAALNAGFAHANTPYFMSLDADDELDRSCVETLLTAAQSGTSADVISHDMWVMEGDLPRHRFLGWTEERRLTLEDLLLGTIIPGAGTMYAQWVFCALGGYDEDTFCEDQDFWMRALAEGARHLYVPLPLYSYRIGNPTQKTCDTSRLLQARQQVLERLIASGALNGGQVELARQGVERAKRLQHELEALGGKTMDAAAQEHMEASALRMRRWVATLLPDPLVDAAMHVVHSVSWIIRPLRRLLVHLRLEATLRSGRRSDGSRRPR